MQFLFGEYGWIIITAAFFGFLFYVRFKRKQDLKWIAERFPGETPIISSFGVFFFGNESDKGAVRRISGMLLLFNHGILFKAKSGFEWEAPAENVIGVGHDTSIRGRDLNQSVMIVEFVNRDNQPDRAAFRAPYPPQWMDAIRSVLLKRIKVSGDATSNLDG